MSSSFIVREASKSVKKLRINLSASSGSGKTYGGLLLAKGIAGDWGKIAVIDTENRSADMYSDFGAYKVIEFDKPYSPERYIEAIKYAESLPEIEVIIIDSTSHEWNGKGGCLEIHATLGGTFREWSKVTPRHNNFIDAILQSRCHVICTARRKEEYAITTGTDGKSRVSKLGMNEIQRDGFSYEMDIVFEIENANHMVTVSKDRTNIYQDRPEFIITEETGKELAAWANKGTNEIDIAISVLRKVSSWDEFLTVYTKYKHLKDIYPDFRELLKEKKEEFESSKAQTANN